MPSLYAKTLSQVVNDTLRYCNDYRGEEENGFTWLRSEVIARANDLLLELVQKTGILRDTQTIPLKKDINIYDLPPDCIRPLRFMIHGLGGNIVLPRTMSELDLQGQPLAVKGDPYYFLRDHLAPSQVAFFPTPYRTGSTFTRDSDYGLLRQIKDADGNLLPFDANLPLRRIRGVPFVRRGNGGIIREVISTYGNMQVTFVRAPEKWGDPEKYPDSDIPDWIHPHLKYGVAEKVLISSKRPLHALKLQRAVLKWAAARFELQRHCDYLGPMAGMESV